MAGFYPAVLNRPKRLVASAGQRRPEPDMTLPRSAADVLSHHVTFEIECIDRMYLNVYVPKLQYELGVVGFFRGHRGAPIASSALMDPMTKHFVATIEHFVDEQGIDLITFAKGERKDDVALAYLSQFEGKEGVLFVGKAQEKTTAYRTEKRRNPLTGRPYPWIVRATLLVNHYYFYCVDADFGPFFIKFCSYFPYNAKIWLLWIFLHKQHYAPPRVMSW
jgi:hypothetical protein